MFVACLVGGTAVELITVMHQEIGNFYHSQAVVMLFGRREPLYMLLGCYGWITYMAMVLADKYGCGYTETAAFAGLIGSEAWVSTTTTTDCCCCVLLRTAAYCCVLLLRTAVLDMRISDADSTPVHLCEGGADANLEAKKISILKLYIRRNDGRGERNTAPYQHAISPREWWWWWWYVCVWGSNFICMLTTAHTACDVDVNILTDNTHTGDSY